MKKIIVAGIGPGSPEDITPAVLEAVRQSDVVVGYKYYFQFIEPYLTPNTECIDTGMRQERDRAAEAFRIAEEGKTVCVISSGDAGIYGMAPLLWEMKRELASEIDIVVLPGISAFQKAASILGAPLGHDLCLISLSDLMTPWALIERRIRAAAIGDFVTCIYNPRSHNRYWQLSRLQEIFLEERSADTVVGFVRNAGREDEQKTLTTLKDFNPEDVDMFTIVLIGNSQTMNSDGVMITPRGYYRKKDTEQTDTKGAAIMNHSFATILSEMRNPDIPSWKLWPMLHAIHTTADFAMEDCLKMDDHATELIYAKVASKQLKHIVTDVSMVASGIRKGALERLGIEVHCYINDPRVIEQVQAFNSKGNEKVTRSEICMRLAAEEHPDALFAIGNAPTALLELCKLVRLGKAKPAGIVAAPVGFVHVCESKHAVKTLHDIPKLIVDGRKGGSNLAATLVNSILTYDDAKAIKPGRDFV